MARERVTVDTWEIQSQYDGKWELECTEMNRYAMKTNMRAYRENYDRPVRVVKKRVRKDTLSEHELLHMPYHEAKDALEWFTTLLKNKPDNKNLQRRVETWKVLMERRKPACCKTPA